MTPKRVAGRLGRRSQGPPRSAASWLRWDGDPRIDAALSLGAPDKTSS
jgi:hypothetical protein